jgi:hypothetical protein
MFHIQASGVTRRQALFNMTEPVGVKAEREQRAIKN